MIVSIEQINAVAFALDLEHRSAEVCAPLSLRVGMATGHALLFEGDDYIGSAVNMAARLCDAAGPFEVLMPTMQIERLPAGRHGQRPRAGRAARLPRPDRRGRARRRAGAGGQHRHRRAVDSQPLRVIHGAVVPQSRLDRARFHEDLVLLAGLGASTVRITLDWSWLQPKAGAFDGDAVEWYAGLLQHGRRPRDRRCSSPCWSVTCRSGSTTTAGSPMRASPAIGGRDGSKVCRSDSATRSAGWVPFDNPLAYANRVIPDDPRRHGERARHAGRRVARRLAHPARRPTGRHRDRREDGSAGRSDHPGRRGSSPPGPAALGPVAARRLHDGTISIPGRADRELADLAGSCDVLGIVVADVDESLGAVLRTAEMGPDRPLAITLITPTGQRRRSGDRRRALRARLRRGSRGRAAAGRWR